MQSQPKNYIIHHHHIFTTTTITTTYYLSTPLLNLGSFFDDYFPLCCEIRNRIRNQLTSVSASIIHLSCSDLERARLSLSVFRENIRVQKLFALQLNKIIMCSLRTGFLSRARDFYSPFCTLLYTFVWIYNSGKFHQWSLQKAIVKNPSWRQYRYGSINRARFRVKLRN